MAAPMAAPMAAAATAASCIGPCRARLLHFSRNNTAGFVVPTSKALKKITARFRELRAAILLHARRVGDARVQAAAQRPLCLDVGAAAYGHVDWADGSDSLLLLDQFGHVDGAQIHAFEMQPQHAERLARIVARTRKQLKSKSRAEVIVHSTGLSDAPSRDHSVVAQGGASVHNTFSLGRRVAKASARVGLRVNVSTIDLWADAQRLDRPLFYIKVDVEGGEPRVLAGMRRLLASPHAPLFMSFEYSWTWSQTIASLNARRRQRFRTRAPPPTSVGEPSLQTFVANLTAHGYNAYLLHARGLVRISGPWWHPFYELAALPDPIDCWHDIFVARPGVAQRALTSLFNARPFPCQVDERKACRTTASASTPLDAVLGADCVRCELAS